MIMMTRTLFNSVEVQNGILRELNTGTDYNILGDELARRTFDESGHYYTRDFLTTVHNSLNNGFGNRGIYGPNQTTYQGNKPSDDLGIYKISPGKAYVRGYEVELRGPSLLTSPNQEPPKLWREDQYLSPSVLHSKSIEHSDPLSWI